MKNTRQHIWIITLTIVVIFTVIPHTTHAQLQLAPHLASNSTPKTDIPLRLPPQEQTLALEQLKELQQIIHTQDGAHLLAYLPKKIQAQNQDLINAFIDPQSDNLLCAGEEKNIIFTEQFIAQCPAIWTYLEELTLLQIEPLQQTISSVTQFSAPKGYQKLLHAQFTPSEETTLESLLAPGIYIEISITPEENNPEGEEETIYYIFSMQNEQLILDNTFRLP